MHQTCSSVPLRLACSCVTLQLNTLLQIDIICSSRAVASHTSVTHSAGLEFTLSSLSSAMLMCRPTVTLWLHAELQICTLKPAMMHGQHIGPHTADMLSALIVCSSTTVSGGALLPCEGNHLAMHIQYPCSASNTLLHMSADVHITHMRRVAADSQVI